MSTRLTRKDVAQPPAGELARRVWPRSTGLIGLLLLLGLLAGCRSEAPRPDVQLRRENFALREQIRELERQIQAERDLVHAAERRIDTIPTLPPERLDELFLVNGLRFGRLTGGLQLDNGMRGHDGLIIYIVPIDRMNQPLKAAGAFVVEAFDLAESSEPLVGRWEFPVDQAESNWYGAALLYTYVLRCPWQDVLPQNPELTVRVSFTEALTGRVFVVQRIVTIDPPRPHDPPRFTHTE
jgi:hypothetical protein